MRSKVSFNELFLILLLNVGIIENFFVLLSDLLKIDSVWCGGISKAIFVFSFVYFVVHFFSKQQFRKYIKKGLVLLTFLLLFLISYFSYFLIRDFIISSTITFLLHCMLPFLIINKSVDFKGLIKLEKIMIPFVIVFAILCISSNSFDYLTVSYEVLPFCLISLLIYLRERRIKFLLAFIVLESSLLILGGRGAILISFIMAIVLLYYPLFNKISNGRKALCTFVLVIFAAFVFIFSDTILSFAAKIIPNSRWGNIAGRGFFGDSIRISMYESGIDFSFKNLFSFRSVLFDRYYYAYTFNGTDSLGFYVSSDMISGLYAHNLWLEMCMDFTPILGTLFFGYLIVRIHKSLNFSSDTYLRMFLLVAVMCGFVKLLFSGSFLIDPWFWCMFGLVIKENGIKKERRIFQEVIV